MTLKSFVAVHDAGLAERPIGGVKRGAAAPIAGSLRLSVLVTDAEERAALAAVRSLGRWGHRVIVCSPKTKALAGGSRFSQAEHQVPNPLADPGEYAKVVRDLVRENRIDCVIPISEASLLALLPIRDELGSALNAFPSLGAFSAVSDKQKLLEAARSEGIAVPWQIVVASRDELDVLIADTLPYPVVLKPARSVIGQEGARTKVGVTHAISAGVLRERLRSYPAEAYPVMIQQRIIGPGVGIFLLIWQGELLAEFAHRRIREKPPAGGVSVYRESIAADPALVAKSSSLLRRFDWCGVAMVEFKVEEATGTPYLMEINGRFWGSLQLAVDAGVDFPALLLSAAAGEAPAPVLKYRTGVRSRWWWGDVDQLLLRLRRSDRDLSLPPGSPGRLRSLAQFLVLWRPGDRNEVFRFSDGGPLLRETREWFRNLLKR